MNDVGDEDAGDRLLIDAAAHGRRDAFEALYRRYAGDVFRFVRNLVRDDGIAEEITSDAMVAVWRGAARFGGRARVRTWIFGIAHHKAIDALRRRRPETVTLEDAAGTPSRCAGPEEEAMHDAERAHLSRALAMLSPEHRAVIELTFVAGFSQKEIADIVDVPVATVKTRAFYAKQRLRDALAALEEMR